MDRIYLDHAAATPVSKKVLAAMTPYFTENFYNPSALYLAAQSVSKDIAVARESVASVLGVRPSEIIFTAGGTEANNLAIRGIMQRFPQSNVVVSAIDHDSVIEPTVLFNHKKLAVTSKALIDIASLRQTIDDSTVLVSIGYVNSEVGVIQPLAEVRELLNEIIDERRQRGNELPLYFHTDACQAGNYLSLHVHKLGVDLMTLNGGKVYGPKQSGALYVRAGIELAPQILGGGQEFSMRSGTENVPSIIGFASALVDAQAKRLSETARLSKLQQEFIDALQKINSVSINGSIKHRVANNVHVTFEGYDNERLLMELDERGVLCATGSACSASKDTPSHVLKAMGLSDAAARSSLRFSFGRDTDQAKLDQVYSTLQELLAD